MVFDPQKVSYSKADIEREASNTELSDGWYKFAIDSATVKDDDSGNIIVNNKVSPLDPEDGETRKRPNMWVRITLPLTNPDRPDHVPPDWAKGITRDFIRALDPDAVPDAPKRVEGVWMFDGEEIGADEVEEKKLEATEKLLAAADKWCKNGNLFKDYTFYGKIVRSQGTGQNEGRTFVNIKFPKAELPDGEALVPAEQFVVRAAPKAKTNGTNGHAAPPPSAKVAAKGKKKS